jgi:hypothetical protein
MYLPTTYFHVPMIESCNVFEFLLSCAFNRVIKPVILHFVEVISALVHLT